jgi:spermidine synthase
MTYQNTSTARSRELNFYCISKTRFVSSFLLSFFLFCFFESFSFSFSFSFSKSCGSTASLPHSNSTMDALKSTSSRWFSEISDMWPGQALSLEVEEVLFDEKSEYQHVQVLRTRAFGTILVLDGAIQATPKDEFAYHEMLVHVPLCAHPKPERVLIIGGGDGGCIREVLKHESVTEVVLCEIDKMVIDVSKQFLPEISCGFSDPRVKIHLGDGALFAKQHASHFDVVIVDASDPIGPASTLYSEEFYRDLSAGLRAGGLLCAQAESMWLHLSLVKAMADNGRRIFSHVDYANISIPSYPGGSIGALLMANHAFTTPVRKAPFASNLQYYSEEMHAASFVLPAFVRTVLGSSE